MRKLWILLILGAGVATMAVYIFILNSPTIVLPTVRLTSPKGSLINSLQQKMGVKELSLKLQTSGVVSVNGDKQNLLQLRYDPASLKNSEELVTSLTLPKEIRQMYKIVQIVPIVQIIKLNWNLSFLYFYHIMPIQGEIIFIST